MKCPVCRASYRSKSTSQEQNQTKSRGSTLLCRRCGADLSSLIQLHDQAIWHYRQAIHLLELADYKAAQAQIDRAIALNHRNAEFHALAGQLWALRGEFCQAIATWQQAQRFDPTNARASNCLRLLRELKSDL